MRTDPAAGAAVAIGGSVTLVVSRGVEPPPEPEVVTVPFLVGQSLDEAREVLDDLGLSVQVRSSLPFGIRENPQVIGQSLGPGSIVEEGTQIVLDTL
ncbi:MAG: PASTA domain-containing protein [Pseudonocardia sp.]|nr:PASTA domain-containing protein [Pseudonocardia sp.]